MSPFELQCNTFKTKSNTLLLEGSKINITETNGSPDISRGVQLFQLLIEILVPRSPNILKYKDP